jgi:hypothetical protein
MPNTSRNDDTATTADAVQINRGGIRTADVSVTNYTTLFADSTTYLQITGLYGFCN